MLRAKCLECISLVGMAVGREQCREDAKRMMGMIMHWQQDTEDPTFSYTLQAGARLCKCLGEEFLPYMDAVMPSLMKAADDDNYYEVRLGGFTFCCVMMFDQSPWALSLQIDESLPVDQQTIARCCQPCQVTNEDEDDDDLDDDVATFQLGDKNLQIRISALEEKATACNMLRCYADELKEGFFRFVSRAAHAALALLRSTTLILGVSLLLQVGGRSR